jgi:hypothetical protein
MSQNNNDLSTSAELSLKDVVLMIIGWWAFIRSKWISIFIVGAVCGVLGFVYALFQKPVYKAELSFALEDSKSGSGLSGALGLASQFGVDIGGVGGEGSGEFSGDNLLELMKSRTMVEKALLTAVNIKGKNETLANLYIEFNDFREKWKKQPALQSLQFLPNSDRSHYNLSQDSILGVFHRTIVKDNLTVDKLDKKLSIISLKVNSSNELFSKYFAEVLAKVVSDFYIQTTTKKEAQSVGVLQRQTDSVRQALNAAISGVATSIDANPNPNPAFQALRVPSQKRTVDVQANTAILSELVKELEMSKMALLHETPLIQVIDKPILPLEKEKTSKIKSLLIGGIIGVILMVIILSVKKLYNSILV